jgi:Zn-dependent M28 family amino/carboxypeptidase
VIARPAVVSFRTAALLAASIAAVPTFGGRATADAPGFTAPVGIQPVLDQVDQDRMRADLKFLSDDLFEGRGTGQRGGELAARYLETRFRLLGLKPGASPTSWLQEVPLVGVEPLPDSRLEIEAGGKRFVPERLVDYVGCSETQKETSDIDAAVVFVGYGIVAPEQRWDDFKGTDVRGKVLLMLVNDPPSEDPSFFGGKALTYYGRWTYKYESAARAGAAGAILIHTDASAGYGWNVVKNSWGRERPYPRLEAGAHPLGLVSWVSENFARQILTAAGQDFEALREAAGRRDFRPRPLTMKVKANLRQKVRPITTWNVLGMLPGSDPKLAPEAVVFTAHYDHLGVGPAENGDAIYNGAADNASGVSALLETARLFAALPRAPRRSVLFMACAAEESGLRGSEYYAKHPVVPLDRTAAALNMDGLAVDGAPRDYTFLGAERSSLQDLVRDASRVLDFDVIPDPHPDQGSFFRSDQFNFARAGVPAMSIDPGVNYKGKPAGWGEAAWKEYEQKRYHRPTDAYDEGFDLSGMRETVRIALYLGWRIAETDSAPVLNPGDEFAPARKP